MANIKKKYSANATAIAYSDCARGPLITKVAKLATHEINSA